jgi:hypothetical protein
LGVPQPEPTTNDIEKNAYVFERDVTFQEPDGTTSIGRIDLYKRSCFVLEAKQGSDAATPDEAALTWAAAPRQASSGTDSTPANRPKKKRGTAVRGTPAWDDAMIRARGQADRYARALPGSEGWPAFLIVVDVGHVIELYSEFTRQGKTYVPFPHRTENCRDSCTLRHWQPMSVIPTHSDQCRNGTEPTTLNFRWHALISGKPTTGRCWNYMPDKDARFSSRSRIATWGPPIRSTSGRWSDSGGHNWQGHSG